MYPCADGATPLAGICGWRQILRPANFIDVAQEAIETGLSSTLPPAVRHHRLPHKLLPVRVQGYAFNSHLQKIVFSLFLSRKINVKDGPAAGGPPGASRAGASRAGASRAGASRAGPPGQGPPGQGPPGQGPPDQELQNREGSQLAGPWSQGPHARARTLQASWKG